MVETNGSKPLPAHVEETVRSIARLHAEHHRQATPIQRAVERLTALVGRPRFIGALTIFVAFWFAANLTLQAFGLKAFDPPPFNGLAMLASLVALYVTVMILATQRRENALAQRREQLTLELAILSEQKTAKTIQLIEEMRRDSLNLRDRVDEEAEAMAIPADTIVVLEAIRETHAEAEAEALAVLGSEAGDLSSPID
jgi:uncharacterized membrane protein